MEISNNVWFYSLSAIPQTLGTIIALTATFLIFKFNTYQQNRKDFLSQMIRFLVLLKRGISGNDILALNDTEILDILNKIKQLDPENKYLGVEKEHYNKFETEMHFQISKDRGRSSVNKKLIYDFLLTQHEYFKLLVITKNKYIDALNDNLFPISVTISLSIIVLPMYEILLNYKYLMICIFIFTVIIALYSIINSAYTVYKISIE